MTEYDNNEAVESVGFDYPEGDERDELAACRRETVIRLLDFLASRGDPETVGRAALILAFLMHCPSAPSRQVDLAKKFGVTEGAISKLLKSAREKMRGNIGPFAP